MSDALSVESEGGSQQRVADTSETSIHTCLVGGRKLIRSGISTLLDSRDIHVAAVYESEPDLEDAIATLRTANDRPWNSITLILDNKAFSTIHRIREALKGLPWEVALIVISQHVSRGEVYAALRIGAKAYIDLDSSADELAKAIRLADRGQVHLAPDVAALLVNDMSAALDTDNAQNPTGNELSRRETEIVQLLCEGLSSKQIARRLHLSAKTIENHRYNIYRKCEVDSIAGLMRHAIQHGMVSI
jgi:DNA-binding NarL/FixJ family response regulator